MRLLLILCVATLSSCAAQHVPATMPTTPSVQTTGPVLTDDQVFNVRTLKALEDAANAECQSLTASKNWVALRTTFTARMAQTYPGFQIDWERGELIPAGVPEP